MEMDLFEKALLFAAKAHHGARRKSQDIPYILHPMEVAVIVSAMTEDREVMAAALLHDTVEDTEADLDTIEREFGPRVRKLVASQTEDKRPGIPRSQTWVIRKQEQMNTVANTDDLDIIRLWLADKLANLRSFYRSKLENGDHVWDVFNQKDPALQEWYYRESGRLTERLRDEASWQEYNELLDKMFPPQK